MRISLARKKEEVIFELEDGTEVKYEVREYTGLDEEKFLSKQATKFTTDKSGALAEIKSYEGLYSTLLAFTLYGPDGKLVPEAVISGWPSHVQKALHEVARRVCGMDKDDKENAEDSEKKD